jgi:hypothetical protein
MFRPKRKTSDFSEEIEAHVLIEIDRLREQGLSEDAAQAAAWSPISSSTASLNPRFRRLFSPLSKCRLDL